MKLYFVGICNKANMEPLDPKTKTGILVNRIINETRYQGLGIQVLKTNLYDLVSVPKAMLYDGERWALRVACKSEDIIVMLGSEVKFRMMHFTNNHEKVISIAHPAAIRTKKAEAEYIKDACTQIELIIDQIARQ